MAIDVQFKFDLEETITIVASGRDGTVVGMWVDRDNLKWCRVEYVLDSGEIKEGWFREKDLG